MTVGKGVTQGSDAAQVACRVVEAKPPAASSGVESGIQTSEAVATRSESAAQAGSSLVDSRPASSRTQPQRPSVPVGGDETESSVVVRRGPRIAAKVKQAEALLTAGVPEHKRRLLRAAVVRRDEALLDALLADDELSPLR